MTLRKLIDSLWEEDLDKELVFNTGGAKTEEEVIDINYFSLQDDKINLFNE